MDFRDITMDTRIAQVRETTTFTWQVVPGILAPPHHVMEAANAQRIGPNVAQQRSRIVTAIWESGLPPPMKST
jgi:hypothetical protein